MLNQFNESENMAKFEIMDGAPIKGETIPIRLFLGGYELGPTFQGNTLQQKGSTLSIHYL